MRKAFTLLLGLSLCGAAQLARAEVADVFEIRWAGESTQPAGFGAPDYNVYTQGDSAVTDFASFASPVLYPGLAAALHMAPELVAKAEVIAWEGNGGSPALGGGWESSNWSFTDSFGATGSAQFQQATSPIFIGNGTLTGAEYAALFGLPAVQEVYSFLLIDVDPVGGVSAAHLTKVSLVSPSTVPPGFENTPDPDAVGLIQPHPVPAPQTWALTLAGLLLLAGVMRSRRA
jgi:hypothetical protein